jgi:hypothetical protein
MENNMNNKQKRRRDLQRKQARRQINRNTSGGQAPRRPTAAARRRRRRRARGVSRGNRAATILCAVLLCILLVVLMVTVVMQMHADNQEPETTTVSEPELETDTELEGESEDTTKEEITTVEEETTVNELVENTNTDIDKLVKKYFKAKAAASEKKLNKLVDNLSDDVMKDIKNEKEYIESYTVDSLQLKNGMTENTYVVYAYYQTKFMNIDTAAPSCTILYVVYNEEDKNWYIHAWTDGSDIGSYITSLNKDDDVKAFYKKVNKALKKARKKDTDLDEFCALLTGE